MDSYGKDTIVPVLWFTGLPCSGKSTLASMIAPALEKQWGRVQTLDGDEVRRSLSAGDGFDRKGRDRHLLRMAYVAKLLSSHGVPTLVACISPYRYNRTLAAEIIGSGLVVVYVSCPLEICEQRDVKGMYAKARAREIEHFTGVTDIFEPPRYPNVTVHTDNETPEQSARKILDFLGLESQ